MLKRLCYILLILSNSFISSEDHKIINFAGTSDIFGNFWIMSFIEYWDNLNKDYPTSFIVKNNKIPYKYENNKITLGSIDKTLELPHQNFFLAKFDHSFGEVTDNIYWGGSLAYLRANFIGSGKLLDIQNSSCYQTNGFGLGGYFQWQNEEEIDYSLFVKGSILLLGQVISCKQINTKFATYTLVTKNKIESPVTVGGLLMFQLGFKIGCLEISFFIAYNQSLDVNFIINGGRTSQNIHCKNIYMGINIGFLFK